MNYGAKSAPVAAWPSSYFLGSARLPGDFVDSNEFSEGHSFQSNFAEISEGLGLSRAALMLLIFAALAAAVMPSNSLSETAPVNGTRFPKTFH